MLYRIQKDSGNLKSQEKEKILNRVWIAFEVLYRPFAWWMKFMDAPDERWQTSSNENALLCRYALYSFWLKGDLQNIEKTSTTKLNLNLLKIWNSNSSHFNSRNEQSQKGLIQNCTFRNVSVSPHIEPSFSRPKTIPSGTNFLVHVPSCHLLRWIPISSFNFVRL